MAKMSQLSKVEYERRTYSRIKYIKHHRITRHADQRCTHKKLLIPVGNHSTYNDRRSRRLIKLQTFSRSSIDLLTAHSATIMATQDPKQNRKQEANHAHSISDHHFDLARPCN